MVSFDKKNFDEFCDKRFWRQLSVENLVWNDEDLKNVLKHPEILEGYEYLSESMFENMKSYMNNIIRNFLGDLLAGDSLDFLQHVYRPKLIGFWSHYAQLADGVVTDSYLSKEKLISLYKISKKLFKNF
jgi:hypothetical protein